MTHHCPTRRFGRPVGAAFLVWSTLVPACRADDEAADASSQAGDTEGETPVTAGPGPGSGPGGTADGDGTASDTEAASDGACDPEAGDDCGALGTIARVYMAQTHVLEPTDPLFELVSDRDALIKVQVVAPGRPPSPAVSATLTLDGRAMELVLEGPAALPTSFVGDLGIVRHSLDDSFTGIVPAAWVQPGLTIDVAAGADTLELRDLRIGAPTTVIMTMFDAHYFQLSPGDYPAGWKDELEAKWPVAGVEVRRVPSVVFSELVVPPRAELPAVRLSAMEDYMVQTGQPFDGEQATASQWAGALKAAAGTAGRVSLYYVNIYGANAGGQAGGFGGVGNGTGAGILLHELGHALSLPHWGDSPEYPYKGEMYGIMPDPEAFNGTHAGPTWAFHLPTRTFIPPTVQESAVGGMIGVYKADPMQGGGQGDQEMGFIYRHFSDYSVNQMRNYLEEHVVIWNDAISSYASWSDETRDYGTPVANDGVQFAVLRDVEVISVMAAVSGASPEVSMVYPPIGPYTAGLIDVFDPSNETDRAAAEAVFCPDTGCDVSLRIVQGGVEKVVMLPSSWDPAADPLAPDSLRTRAVNLPAADGEVTRVELLLTPEAEHDGLPPNSTVLDVWSP